VLLLLLLPAWQVIENDRLVCACFCDYTAGARLRCVIFYDFYVGTNCAGEHINLFGASAMCILLQETTQLAHFLVARPAVLPACYVTCYICCYADGWPLSLSQLLQDLPALQQYRDASQADWTFITQVVRLLCCS
jgi:hypothetical protein